jgi:hypothetical protein
LCWRLGGQYCAAGECHPTMAHWVWALLVPLASHRVPRSPSAPCRWQANQVLEGLKSLVAARRKEETGGWRSTLQCNTRCVEDRNRCLMSLRAECGYPGCRSPAHLEMGLGRGLRPAGCQLSVGGGLSTPQPEYPALLQPTGGQWETALRLPVKTGWDSINPQSRITCILTIGNESSECANRCWLVSDRMQGYILG